MSVRSAQDHFASRKWGVFTHYISVLQNNPSMPQSLGRETTWNECTADLDVKKLAKTLHEIGAGYLFFTVMQGTRYLAAPNRTYSEITGTNPYSERDLIEELYAALEPYGIDLCLYFTGDGPYKSEPEGSAFGLSAERGHVSNEFVRKWTSVLREYAMRYGKKVKAWWIDGCYSDFLGYRPEQLKMYVDACKAGNPNVLVALNSGHVLGYTEDELNALSGDRYESESERAELAAINASVLIEEQDLICGEQQKLLGYIPRERFLGRWKRAQAHILAPLGVSSSGIGGSWASDGLSCSGDELVEYIRKVNAIGGCVSVDVILYRDGSLSEMQTATLKMVGRML